MASMGQKHVKLGLQIAGDLDEQKLMVCQVRRRRQSVKARALTDVVVIGYGEVFRVVEVRIVNLPQHHHHQLQ